MERVFSRMSQNPPQARCPPRATAELDIARVAAKSRHVRTISQLLVSCSHIYQFRPSWIMMRSATDLSKADLHVFSKLFDDGLERGQEAEAFSWRQIGGRQIGGHDDVLDFFVGHLINIEMTRQPAP